MKKKLLTFILLCAMVLSTSLVAFAGDNVDGGTAVKADSATAVVIDVRSADNYAKGYLKNSYSWPLFNQNGVTTGEDELAQSFTTLANSYKPALTGKDLYILCNSGARGAEAATKLLVAVGYDESKIHTITNGAKDLEIRYAFLNTNNFVSGTQTLEDMEKGDAIVLDVRNDANYDAGHLVGSVHIPVFNENGAPVGTADEDLAKAFVEAVKGNAELQGKKIYVLCNSGNKGARAATVLLKDAGYGVDNIFTITGGAGADAVKTSDKFVETVKEYAFVTGEQALKADPAKTVIIDVRTEANFKKGTIKDALNWPLFNDKGVTNGKDELAAAFTAKVKENAELLAGKDIYILCNSGARGAQAATQLLRDAGYKPATTEGGIVYTIKNGATDINFRYSLLDPTKLSTVTGKEAVAAIGNSKILLLDVRASEVYGAGHLKGSLSLPVFSPSVVTSTKDELAVAFTDCVKANLDTFKAFEHIYILCNSGRSGAVAATVLLTDAGVDLTKVSTITDGAKGTTDDMSVPNALTYVSGAHTINTLGQEGYLVLDVRSAEKYAAGHLKGSLSLPVFDKNNKLDTDDAKALAEKFLAYVKANKADFDGKTIYVLCNSGARGAAKAIELLGQAGVNAKVFTIEGGANSVVKDFFVKATAPNTGDSSAVMFYAVVMLLAVAVIAGKKQYAK